MPPIAPPPSGTVPLSALLDEESRKKFLAELLLLELLGGDQQGDRIDVLIAAIWDLGDEVNRLLAARKRTLRRAASYRQQIAEMRAAALDGAPE